MPDTRAADILRTWRRAAIRLRASPNPCDPGWCDRRTRAAAILSRPPISSPYLLVPLPCFLALSLFLRPLPFLPLEYIPLDRSRFNVNLYSGCASYRVGAASRMNQDSSTITPTPNPHHAYFISRFSNPRRYLRDFSVIYLSLSSNESRRASSARNAFQE